MSASARVSDLNFWSWGYGYLYNVTTTLKVDGKPVDVVHTRTGFRKTGVRPRDGEAERPRDSAQRLRPAHHQRMAGGRPIGAAVDERLQQRAHGREQRQPRALDARDAVETGCRIAATGSG